MSVNTLAPQQLQNRYIRTFFNGQPLGPEWIYLQNPISENYGQRDGRLFLTAHGSLFENRQPTFVGRRQESAVMTVETEIDTDLLDFGTEAGLTVYQINTGHLDLALVKYQTGSVAVVTKACVMSLLREDMGEDSGQLRGKIRLRIESDGKQYRFCYCTEDGLWKQVAAHDCPLVSTEVVGGFTGAVLGMYAEGNGSAAFNYFEYYE